MWNKVQGITEVGFLEMSFSGLPLNWDMLQVLVQQLDLATSKSAPTVQILNMSSHY